MFSLPHPFDCCDWYCVCLTQTCIITRGMAYATRCQAEGPNSLYATHLAGRVHGPRRNHRAEGSQLRSSAASPLNGAGGLVQRPWRTAEICERGVSERYRCLSAWLISAYTAFSTLFHLHVQAQLGFEPTTSGTRRGRHAVHSAIAAGSPTAHNIFF